MSNAVIEESTADSVPTFAELEPSVRAMMDAAWREPGFCVPNQDTYPHQWLWDSCFHAIVFAALGSEDRCVTEISSVFARQGSDGFVPHMIYWAAADLHADFWGRSGASSITQPPMYGHAIAAVVEAGYSVPPVLLSQAANGLLHLGRRPRTPAGLVPVFHPWETGCDDSARWDSWLPNEALASDERVAAWRVRKEELVQCLELGGEGQAIGNPEFAVGSIGFNSLVAWNARELASVLAADPAFPLDRGIDADLEAMAADLEALAADVSSAVAARWDGDRWVDDGPPSGRARTLDAMAALLVDPRAEALQELTAPDAFGAPFGPTGVHRGEPSFDPQVYWRGPAWPQLSYLLMVAAERAGEEMVALALAEQLARGAKTSGLAEFWNPETGQGLGAVPQSWAGLGLVAAARLG